MVNEISKIHKIKIPANSTILPYFLSSDFETDFNSENNEITKFIFDLELLPKEIISKLAQSFPYFNDKNNPLLYKINLTGTELTIGISLNDNFDKASPLLLPFKFETIVNKTNIQDLRVGINSLTNIDANLKQNILIKIKKLEETYEVLLEKVAAIPRDEESFTLCHYDLNLSNILVTSEKKVYLIDYDLIGMGFIYSDFSMFLGNLHIKIDFKTGAVSYGNDIELIQKQLYQMYTKYRPLSVSEAQFFEKINLLRFINVALYSIILPMNAYKNNSIPCFSLGLFLLENYEKVLEEMIKDFK